MAQSASPSACLCNDLGWHRGHIRHVLACETRGRRLAVSRDQQPANLGEEMEGEYSAIHPSLSSSASISKIVEERPQRRRPKRLTPRTCLEGHSDMGVPVAVVPASWSLNANR